MYKNKFREIIILNTKLDKLYRHVDENNYFEKMETILNNIFLKYSIFFKYMRWKNKCKLYILVETYKII